MFPFSMFLTIRSGLSWCFIIALTAVIGAKQSFINSIPTTSLYITTTTMVSVQQLFINSFPTISAVETQQSQRNVTKLSSTMTVDDSINNNNATAFAAAAPHQHPLRPSLRHLVLSVPDAAPCIYNFRDLDPIALSNPSSPTVRGFQYLDAPLFRKEAIKKPLSVPEFQATGSAEEIGEEVATFSSIVNTTTPAMAADDYINNNNATAFTAAAHQHPPRLILRHQVSSQLCQVLCFSRSDNIAIRRNQIQFRHKLRVCGVELGSYLFVY